jgi:Protein of unknown function (DUF2971)
MLKPQYLYKYESLSQQSLENLKSQILYFGSPLEFNDPYDCAFTPNIIIPSDLEVESIRKNLIANLSSDPDKQALYTRIEASQFKQTLLNSGRAVFNIYIKNFLQTKGISCFSENNNNLLMWSHYGQACKGFCLEFSTDHEPFQKAMKVKYQNNLPQISLTDLLVSKNFESAAEFWHIKSESWSYEAEWRIAHQKAKTKYHYSTESLTGIYFGPDISNESLNIICLILAGQNETVKLWRGRRSTKEFKVEFDQITYVSNFDAKRKGLL